MAQEFEERKDRRDAKDPKDCIESQKPKDLAADEKLAEAQEESEIVANAAVGAVVGGLLAGPMGALAGVAVGALVEGDDEHPAEKATVVDTSLKKAEPKD
jgi:hypothetical protein